MDLNEEPGELVQNVLDRFDKISETTIDLTEKLKLISDVSSAFVKLGISFGALILSSLDIIAKKLTAEYKALGKLNKHMERQFNKLNDRLTYTFFTEEMDTELREFQNVVRNGNMFVMEDSFI